MLHDPEPLLRFALQVSVGLPVAEMVTVPVAGPVPGAVTLTVAVNVFDSPTTELEFDAPNAVEVFALTMWFSSSLLPLYSAVWPYVAVRTRGVLGWLGVVSTTLQVPVPPVRFPLQVSEPPETVTTTLPVGVP